MCKTFEKLTGKKTKGNKGLLKGLTKMYVDANKKSCIVSVPVEILEVDPSYQTEVRTERDLRYLTDHWDENKLLPLVGVPHWEEGKIYLVDGYGRWISSQLIDKEKYTELDVMIILSAPSKKDERLKFEAEMYAFQNAQVAKMTPLQKHGAMLILHDKATETLEKLKDEYGFEYRATKGNRDASILGSYASTLNLCKVDNGNCANYVFEICRDAGFDRKTNGYATYIMKGLADIYKIYAKDREETKKHLGEVLREITPAILRSNAVTKYPMLDFRSALSLYLEDIIVRDLGLEQSREIEGTKIVPIKKTTFIIPPEVHNGKKITK